MFFNFYGQPEGCQRANCTFYVEWRNNGDQFIDFRMEGNANGWIALGITDSNLRLTNVNNSHTSSTHTQRAQNNGLSFQPISVYGRATSNLVG